MKYKKFRKKTLKHFRYLTRRENISALALIVAIGGISFALRFATTAFLRYRGLERAKRDRHSAYEDELRRLSGITTNLAPVPYPTTDWKTFEGRTYGFSIKYPQEWQNPKIESRSPGSMYLAKIAFDKVGVSKKGNLEGFDVFVYSSLKFPNPIGTDSLIKKNEDIPTEDCPHFDDITLGQKGYPAKEVKISTDDSCWEETFFYSLTKGNFTLTIVPRREEVQSIFSDGQKMSLVKVSPEFYDIVSTLNFAEKTTVSQTAQTIAKKIVSPPQVRFATGASCNHKNDHPRKSKTKGKHMDEDCCPDPDEWPNPRCAYSGGGLGLMRWVR